MVVRFKRNAAGAALLNIRKMYAGGNGKSAVFVRAFRQTGRMFGLPLLLYAKKIWLPNIYTAYRLLRIIYRKTPFIAFGGTLWYNNKYEPYLRKT